MAIKKEKLIVIDGNALIHRSFHALPPTLITKKGEMVNAVYGFATVLIKALKEFKPDYVILTLDKKGRTFRHEKFEDYKGTRVKAPDELYSQIPRVKELTEAFEIPIFEKEGFEADDLIGTIVKITAKNIEKIIVTGDMDTLQLVDDHTKVYTMSRGLSDSVIYDEAMVLERYGLKPEQMIDYKSLRGDPSDNIPGVRGIGEKTAIELLQNFNTLEGVYKNIKSPKIKDRIRELLIEHEKEAYLSYELATIKCDVKIDFDLDKAKFGKFDREKAVQVLSDLEFKSLLPRIVDLGKERRKDENVLENKLERNQEQFKYIMVDDEKKFKKFLTALKKEKAFVFDTETTGFDPITSKLIGISFSWQEGVAYFIVINRIGAQNVLRPLRRSALQDDRQASLFEESKKEVKINTWLNELKPIFEDEKIKKYGHNIKFDYRVMKNNNINIRGVEFDTMIASYLLNPGTRQHNLDSVVFTELGFEKISKEDLLGKGREKIEFGQVPIEKLSNYSCEDADFTFRLVKKLKKQLKEQNMFKLFNEIEMPLLTVLADMEENGIEVDRKHLKKTGEKVNKKIENLKKEIYKSAGEEFNINSTLQLREILFEKLEISTENIGKNKTGFSTSAEELFKLRDAHPIIRLIQEYRELSKLQNTYIESLPELINKKTGRIHTSFNQTITATGRLSSTEPNLQNIPVRTELGREIRHAFVAKGDDILLSLDYSQIELRLAAHMSGDPKMVEAFKTGADIHSSTAAEINQVKPEEVTKEMRREAKATNFGILYGQGPHGLAQTADIPYYQAKSFIDKYFLAFKKVREYIDETVDFARENGYVETLFGRRRYLPEINSSVVMVKKSAERMAVNTPLQGSAADMIKVAMIAIDRMIKENYNKNEVMMILQVHDELIFSVKKNKVKKVAEKCKEIMENVIKLKVPIEVDAETGENWGELEKLK